MGEKVQDTINDSDAVAVMTHAQFLSWKRQKTVMKTSRKHKIGNAIASPRHCKDANESARRTEAARKREVDIRNGVVQMNGRELFMNEPWVFDNNLY